MRKINKNIIDKLLPSIPRGDSYESNKNILPEPVSPAGEEKPQELRGIHNDAAKARPGWLHEDEPASESAKRISPLKRLFAKKTAKPDLSPIKAGAISVADILAPPSIDLKHKDFVVVDSVYHAYLYIVGYGYPSTVGSGWLASLVEAGEGVNISFTVKKQSKDKALSKIAQTTMINRSRMRDVGDTRADYEELDSAVSSGLYLKDSLNRYNEDFYYMHTLIEVTADDADTLEQRVSQVQNLCKAQDMLCRRADYLHAQGFTSCLPLLALDPDLERKAHRNALTSSVAAAFPFSSYEICDMGGILLGLNKHNRTVCMPDFYDTSRYTNGNIFITGTSGSGKTYLLSLIALRLRQQGVQVILIAPLKGYEYRLACEAIGGKYIKLSPSSGDCINVMAIRRRSLHTQDGRSRARGDSLLADKIQKVHTYMRLRRRNMTEGEEQLLDIALVELYARFGITFDNGSVTLPDGSFKPMPTLCDLHDILMEKEETKALALSLSRYVSGSAKTLGGQTNVDLKNRYIVIDISEMPEDILPEWMYVATDFSFDLSSESRIQKKALLLDELWHLIGAASNPLAAAFVTRIVKIYRGMGGIAVLATQDFSDCFSLDDGKYGKAILSNTRMKFVFTLEEEEMLFAQKTLGLSGEEMFQLSRNQRGECLFCIGRNRVNIKIEGTKMEHALISTDRADLEELAGPEH